MLLPFFSNNAISNKAKSLRRTRRLQAEQLEARELMTNRIWSGGAAFNDKWTDKDNWVGAVAPKAGDDLEFPAGIGVLDRGTNNDFPTDTVFNTIKITGNDYKLTGNRVKLTGDFRNEAPNLNVSLENKVNLDIKFAGGTHTIFSSNQNHGISFYNQISDDGQLGQLIIQGGSNLETISFAGNTANTYSQPMFVDNIALILNKEPNTVAIAGPLTINAANKSFVARSGTEANSTAVGQLKSGISITINGSSGPTPALRISTENIGSLILNNAFVQVLGSSFGTSTLTLGSALTSSGLSSIGGNKMAIASQFGTRDFNVTSGTLTLETQLSGGSLRKLGTGDLLLNPIDGPNSYSNTIIEQGVVEARSAVSGRTVLPGTVFVGTIATKNARLFLNSTNEIIANTADIIGGPNAAIDFIGITETVRQLELNCPTVVSEITNSTFTTTLKTVINQNPFNLEGNTQYTTPILSVSNRNLGVNGTSLLIVNGDINLTNAIISGSSSGRVQLAGNVNVTSGSSSGFATATISAVLLLAQGNHDFNINDIPSADDFEMTGTIALAKGVTSANITKKGIGQMKLTGTVNLTTLSTVAQGVMRVDGNFIGTLNVASGAALIGTGTVKTATMATGSVVNPTNFGSGILHATTTALLFNSKFHVDVNSATGFDQLQTNTLIIDRVFDGVSKFLSPVLEVAANFAVPLGTSFKIIDVTGTAAANLDNVFQDAAGNPIPDGGNFVANGQNFTIDYNAGDGNDVVITRNTAPAFANRAITPVITEGQVATLSGHITEPDANDKFFLDVNWGDGKQQTYTFLPGTPRDISVQHKYLDDPTGPNDVYNVKLVWRDQHGGSNKAELPITVNNAAPLVYNLVAKVIDAGQRTVEFTGGFQDPDRLTGLTLMVQWTTGGSYQRYELPAGSKTFSVQNKYASSGLQQISFLLIDDDLGISSGALSVRV